MAIHLYLIRHGRTEWNTLGLLQGTGDSPLTEEGIQGAKLTGKALADVAFNACYSSLMKRAQDTADFIIGDRNIPHFHHRGLNEIHFGSWEGKRSAELAENPEYILLRTDPKSYQAIENKGETIDQLHKRVMNAIEQIVAQHKDGDNILVVSHGMTLTLLTAVLKGIHWHNFRNPDLHTFVANTAISVVKVDNQKIELIQFNNVDHLPS
ncbi:putative phosphoglycerate mutase [Nicoletella semolina]|uniref:phosphoglycerate mutase (2,3-diphosphoglycerate-dependent) n=1 Tax=Nicoletella semolina TaxID=271160 RepID=A0A4R2N544_9PAST|nr:histidine phosphatase family protein [Nicoletella semolina]MDH2924074.1 phosphoglycerate mutase [Nicoletella semolina]TCP15921.1 putative phosphoglycerate mutase [Nicoletella semolina]